MNKLNKIFSLILVGVFIIMGSACLTACKIRQPKEKELTQEEIDLKVFEVYDKVCASCVITENGAFRSVTITQNGNSKVVGFPDRDDEFTGIYVIQGNNMVLCDGEEIVEEYHWLEDDYGYCYYIKEDADAGYGKEKYTREQYLADEGGALIAYYTNIDGLIKGLTAEDPYYDKFEMSKSGKINDDGTYSLFIITEEKKTTTGEKRVIDMKLVLTGDRFVSLEWTVEWFDGNGTCDEFKSFKNAYEYNVQDVKVPYYIKAFPYTSEYTD